MNLQETAELLAVVQLVDNRRQVDAATILAWHELLADVPLAEAREGVRLHRRESTEWILPAHIIANVSRIRRAVAGRQDEYGNPIDDDQEALAARARLTNQGEITA